MTSYSPLFLLGALGVLSAAGTAAAAVDTSEWKCSACPFEKGASGKVDLGVGNVSQQSAKFSDYTGLDKGSYLIADGEARFRNESGFFASIWGTDLGLDARALAGQVGKEGVYTLRLGYDELPRHFAGGAVTPFLGNGGSLLTLPAGFPATSTATMPLANTLQPIEIGYKRSRLDGGFTWIAGENLTYRLNARHDVRDGTQPGAGSFYSTASQLAVPVDQVTDQFELAASYAGKQVQATLAYNASIFRNNQQQLTWTNPFTPVVPGATSGQLALSPDSQFHQIVASAGYELNPQLRASADIAYGRMTQNAGYLAPTLNTNPAAGLPTIADLPSQSLNGRADTFNANLKLTATPMDGLRLNGSYARDVRDNRSASQAYPAVSTDMFLGASARTNLPYSFWQDRFKLIADYRGPGSLKTSGGIEQDNRERSYQEVVTTRETTVWATIAGTAFETLAMSFKLSHANRDNSSYGVATWVDPAENPLLRKFNMAERQRNAAKFRADWTANDKLTVGFNVDLSDDDYSKSTIGLTSGHSYSVGGDMAYALSEQTQLRLFAQGEDIRSKQAGSESYARADWSTKIEDSFGIVGMGVKHLAMAGKLELGADLAFARSRSNVTVDTASPSAGFPAVTTSTDRFKLYATYQLKENLSVIGSYWYERYDTKNWALDGVGPGTVYNLLAFGVQPPRYNENVVRLGLRYRF
jgi:MtrB/PioB family decaheme-associated outer membrane protein